MSENQRFLLGYGERLTAPVTGPASSPPPGPAYSFEEAIQRLAPEAIEVSSSLDALPAEACPNNEAVAVVTLHPQSLAKSYHPGKLLNQYSLRQVGSRPVEIVPDKWTKQGKPELSHSTEIYVAGEREDFDRFAIDFAEAPTRIHESVQRIERLRAPSPEDRLRHLEQAVRREDGLLVELVLHASATDDYVIRAFGDFSSDVGVEAHLEKRVFAGGLCFIPAVATEGQLTQLSDFAFLRTARPAARLRHSPTIERSTPAPQAAKSALPDEDAINSDIRVAVFDGGFPLGSPLSRWVRPFEPASIGGMVPDLIDHGHDVASAVLFGTLTPGIPAERPFAPVDHYRVLDDDANADPFELYEVLQRIDSVLSEKKYDFVNLSIGPYSSIEDDDVHPWTAVLDSHLATGQTLATIAVGNNGGSPDAADRRVQIPADCVNGFSLGAADTTKSGWGRAPYSALGPGRAPGFVKPDVLEFGGTTTEPFIVTDRNNPHGVAFTQGTSFASPSALRRAIALRAHFGERLSPLGIKALLINAADDAQLGRAEMGWGRIPPHLEDVMVCGDGEVRVIYQGVLNPSKYLRARIPLPPAQLQGNVTIHATFTYATETDPEDPGNYSRAGLGVTFRPHDQIFADPGAVDPKSRSFFKRSAFDNEGSLRRDAQMWETTLNHSETLRGSSLRNPVFDVHYNARSNGGTAQSARAIPYALVVTVQAKRERDLYDQVVRAFAGQLEALQPIIELPVRV
ncbi:S8 family peptidase [Microbacterium azadirachtae]|uniref:S8 family peptidase n=1 Tax=Microbacterium azadirachtae TaxID=582680 RepID=UPI003F7567D1